jgi:TetR/AcrR family transcriptional repressor of mexCD-oprJ operon
MAEVAKVAGLGRMTVYAYFPTRANLLQALVRHAITEATRLVAATWHMLDRHRRLRTHAVTALDPDHLDRQHDRSATASKSSRSARTRAVRSPTCPGLDGRDHLSLVHTAADEIEAGRLPRAPRPAR